MSRGPTLSLSHLASVLRAAADEADCLAKLEAQERQDWIDQAASPLGRRRHCAAVRARIASGLPGAAILGRRFLLSETALQEVAATRSKVAATSSTGSTTGVEKLRNALRLVGGDL